MGPWKDKRIDRGALEARRMQAAAWFQEGISEGEVARRLAVSTSATSKWYRAWQRGGLEALRQQAPGPAPQLEAEQLAELKAALIEGPLAQGYVSDLWTLERIRDLIESRWGVHFSIGYVWKVLRKLEMSPQRPQPRAKERDEEAIEAWRRRRWPAKKGAQRGGVSGSSTSTRAAFRSGPRSSGRGRRGA